MVAELSSIDFSSCVGVSIYNVKLLTFDQQNVVLNKFQYAIYNVLVSCLAGNDVRLTNKMVLYQSQSVCKTLLLFENMPFVFGKALPLDL